MLYSLRFISRLRQATIVNHPRGDAYPGRGWLGQAVASLRCAKENGQELNDLILRKERTDRIRTTHAMIMGNNSPDPYFVNYFMEKLLSLVSLYALLVVLVTLI